MVKKRAELKGEGVEIFFSEPEPKTTKRKKSSRTPKKKSEASEAKKRTPEMVPEEFREKIKLLRQMIRQLRVLLDPEEFKNMTGKKLK